MGARSLLLPATAGLLLVGPATSPASAAVLQDSIQLDSADVADARGWIGIRTDTARLPAPGEGILVILVTGIQQGGPAHRGGVLPGDLVVELDGRELVSYEVWHSSVAEVVPGQQLQIRLNRAGSDIETTVVVADQAPPSFRASLRSPQLVDEWSSLLEDLESIVETLPDPLGEVEEPEMVIGRIGSGTRLEPDGSVVLGGAWVRTLSGALGRYFGESSGVLIVDVIPASPARRAGFRPGDVIVAVDGREVTTFPQLRSGLALAELPVSLTVVRHRERLELTYPAR